VSEDASVPVKRWDPRLVPGTVNVQTTFPAPFDTAAQAVPADQLTVTVELPAYPAPENVTNVPTGPDDGLTKSEAVTVNRTNAESRLSAESIAVNRCAPAVAAGMTMTQEKLPEVPDWVP